MAKSFKTFAKELDKEFDVIKEDIEHKYKQTAIDFLDYVTSPPPKGTPRDTGFTSNSWHISLNSPSLNHVGEPSTSTGANTAKARQEESIHNLELATLENIRSIFINNPNSWISDLDAGSSTQNPGGFVAMGGQYAESKIK